MKAVIVKCMLLPGVLLLCGCNSESDVERILNEIAVTPWHNAVAAADMNADGLPDIVSASYDTEGRARINVFVRLPGRGFASKVEFPLPTGTAYRTHDVRVADLDLNGDPDLVVAHIGISATGTNQGNRISVLLKTGTGPAEFDSAATYAVGGLPARIALGDLDRDGLPDVVVATRDGLCLLVQDGGNPGRFGAARQVADGRGTGVQIGDVNNDGLPDLLFAGEFGVRLLAGELNDPGYFAAAGTWITDGSPSDVTLNDFNGDGRLDFAVSHHGPDLALSDDPVTMTSLLQDPVEDARFFAYRAVDIPGCNTLLSIDSADLTGDGLADLVAAVTSGPESVSIAVQVADQSGLFADPDFARSPALSGPFMAVIANLGPDDLPDVVLGNALDGVFVHYGAGAGRFSDAVKIGE